MHHPNIVRLYELFSDGPRLAFTMERIHGVDLLQYVGAPGTVTGWSTDDVQLTQGPDEARLRDSMRQLALGVDALHRAGKLHRDLKPTNVLVDQDGRTRVLDFGLVRETDDEEGSGLTVSGMVMGTPAYMSPEQAEGRKLTPASDWYAVGVILYQCLTGQVPHVDEHSEVGVMLARATTPAADPRHLRDGVPDDLANLCMGLLALRAKDRAGLDEILAIAPASEPQRTVASARGEHPLLGRDAALGALHEAYNSASLGRTVVALVDGVSGIGKTALVDHFLRSLRRRDGVIVLRGRCYERESVPFKALDPLVDHLVRFLRRLPASEAAGLMPRDVHAVARLFPALLDVEVIDRAPRRDGAVGDDLALRARAFEAFKELLGRITDRRPLVLHIDDLQWTDDDSASLLLELLRPPDSPHLLLVGAYRREDADANAALRRLIDGLSRSKPKVDMRRVALGPLPPAHAALLARVLLGEHDLPTEMAEAVARECDGVPLFAGELVRHVAARHRQDGVTPELPPLDEVLRARIDDLPRPAQRVLEVIALAARRIPVPVSLEVAAAPGAGRDALELLRADHYVRTLGTPNDPLVETYHDRIRSAAVERMNEDERQATHRGLAHALRDREDTDPEHLLLHFRAAGERDPAQRYAGLAAARAESSLAFDRAAELYDAALTLSSDAAPHVRAELLRKRGTALANAGRGWDAAHAFLDAAKLEDGALRLDLERRAAEHLLEGGHSDEGRGVLTKVLSAHGLRVPSSQGSVLRALLWRRARLKLRGMSYEERRDVPPAELAKIDAAWSASRGLLITNIFEGAYFTAEHLWLSLGSGDPRRVAMALAEEARNASFFGTRGLARASSLLDRVRSLAERSEDPYLRATALAAEGLVRLMSADWEGALQRATAAGEIFRDECTGAMQDAFDTEAAAAAALFYTGDVAALETLTARTAREATARNNVYHALMARLHLVAPVALAHDEVDTAREELEELTALGEERNLQIFELQSYSARAAVGLYQGQGPQLLAELEPVHTRLRKNPLMRAALSSMDVAASRLRCFLGAAEHDEAHRADLLAAIGRQAKALAKVPFPTAAPFAAVMRGAAANLAGDAERAQSELRNGADSLEALGMTMWAAAARHRLGKLVGGDRGFILQNRAESVMTTAGVKRPEAFSRVFVPGFRD